ncbi:MAG: DUF4388 domain-containing protein [Planctomycetota bacterium]
MSFAGDLQKLPLADVFQSIHQNSLSGALAVRDPRGERLVAFDAGSVIGCADIEGKEEDVADELVRQGKISSKDVSRGQSRFFKRKGTLKRSLSRRHVLESGEFDVFTRSVVLERIYELFLLEEGSFEFVEDYDKARFSDDELSATFKISPSEILMEAMRRVDEWKRIRRAIPSFKEVYVGLREPGGEDDELERALLDLTQGGQRDLDTVLREVPAPRFRACEAVLALVEAKAMRVATGPEYLTLGKAAEAKGDLSAAADFYQRGLHYERGNADLNERLIAVLEKLDRKDAAAAERKVYAGTLLEHGSVERASAQYAAAARLAPSDPLPLERLLELEVDRERSYDKARETAKRLVTLYLRLGLADKAKGVYPRVLGLRPKDRWLRERVAEVHEELSENATAAAIYKELAQEELKLDKTEEATGLLRKAVALAPEDQKAAGLLDELETGRFRALRRRRRVFVAAMVGLVLLAGGVSWGAYEVMALSELRRASVAATVELERGTDGALAGIEILDAVRMAHPRSRAAAWAEELIAGLTDHYVTLALREGDQLGRGLPPERPLPQAEVAARLSAALDPQEGETFKVALERAEGLLNERKTEQAREALAALRPRLDDALLMIRQAGPEARGTTSFDIDVSRVRDLLPNFRLAWAEAVLAHLPGVLERARAARAKLRNGKLPGTARTEAGSEGPKSEGPKTGAAKSGPPKTNKTRPGG